MLAVLINIYFEAEIVDQGADFGRARAYLALFFTRGAPRREGELSEGVASYKMLRARLGRPFWGLFKGEYSVAGSVVVGERLGRGQKGGLCYNCFCSRPPIYFVLKIRKIRRS